jgi:hypothetical protein
LAETVSVPECENDELPNGGIVALRNALPEIIALVDEVEVENRGGDWPGIWDKQLLALEAKLKA